MAITSYGYTGAVNNVQWAQMAGGLGFDYVAKKPDHCKVASVSSGTRTVRISAGSIAGGGVLDINDAPVDITLPNVTSGSKWFMIIAKRVWQTTNATSFTYIEGTAVRQLPVREVGVGVEDDQPLALVRIAAGQTIPAEVVDLRAVGGNNGVMVGYDALCLQYLDAVGTVVRIGDVEWTRALSDVGAEQWVSSAPPLTGTIGYLISAGTPAYGRYSGSYPANIRYRLKDGEVTLSGMVKRIQPTATIGNGAEFPLTQPLPMEIRPTQVLDGVVGTAAASLLSTHAATELIYKSSDGRLYVRHRRYLGDNSPLPITQNSWWVSLEGVSWLV